MSFMERYGLQGLILTRNSKFLLITFFHSHSNHRHQHIGLESDNFSLGLVRQIEVAPQMTRRLTLFWSEKIKAVFGTRVGISMAISSRYWYLRCLSPKAMEPYVEYFGVMIYDLHGL